MNKKHIILFVIIILVIIISIILFYSLNNKDTLASNTVVPSESEVKTEIKTNDIVLNTEDNSMVISTKSTSTIRVINKYEPNMFKNKGDKNLLIMWGSWCPNCSEEFDDIERVVKYYKNSNINIVLIAHEFNANDLINFLETNEYDFDTEILLDLGRVIRKSLDPEATTVPITYVLDKNGNVVNKHSGTLTFEKIQNILKNT